MTTDIRQHSHQLSAIAKARGAFLGAAVGDALGWPQEMPWNRLDKPKNSSQQTFNNRFQQWSHKAGGKYYPHEEVILAGEYTDDTQLLLCTARSLLYGKDWWKHFTQRELPTWNCYERGGGGATKRATKQWLDGKQPWSSSTDKDREKYFDAGGNGVAMRVLPHCILGATETDFSNVARNIAANGVCTHGHPRALVGALAYGFAVWVALRETATLQYGALIERVLVEIKSWSVLPDLQDICPTWKNAVLEFSGGGYEESWETTVTEMEQLLKDCQKGMKRGALSVEQEVLTKLGCFEKKVKGAGTVGAAASIFLASRYAVDPLAGVIEAAFASGADTDTIASMTGGLLGAIAGVEWLQHYADRVQDSEYIKKLAERLVQPTFSTLKDENRATKSLLDSFIEKLKESKSGDRVSIPDGREAKVSAVIEHKSLSQSTLAVSWKLDVADGQSLYVKKISRTKNNEKLEVKNNNSHRQNIELQPVNVLKVALKLPVRDLDKTRFFYEKVLGIKVEKELPGLITYDGIVLESLASKKSLNNNNLEGFNTRPNNTIYIEIESLDEAYNNVVSFGSKILQPISEKSDRRIFTCSDPEGNEVKIIEIAVDF
jgi:ADP-ribosylglycohydrolase/predicted enzyme related to lactoylglutathione lyase